MTEKDQELIATAKKIDWEYIIPMLDNKEYESEECKLKLKDILSWKYHQDEGRQEGLL